MGGYSPQWAMASSFTRFPDHTQRRTTFGRIPLDEWPARRWDLYLTTHNTHIIQTSMHPVGFEPTISASERPQFYARAGINNYYYYYYYYYLCSCSPSRTMASSFLRFLDFTQRRTTFGRTPLDEWSARSRDLYLTTHNTPNIQTSMHPVGIRTHSLSRRAAADLRLRPRDHWDRLAWGI